MRIAVAATLTLASIAGVLAQAGPTFDVVSIKLNTGGVGPGKTAPPIFRPDGSLTLKNVPVNTLIARAYPGTEIVGLPDWVRSRTVQVATTSMLTAATTDDRIAMLRAMLAGSIPVEGSHRAARAAGVRSRPRAQGRQGRPGAHAFGRELRLAARPVNGAAGASERASAAVHRTAWSWRLCAPTEQGRLGDLLEGNTSMDQFADALRVSAGRVVINKTGLPGSYRIAMNYDMMGASGLRRSIRRRTPAPRCSPRSRNSSG